MEQDAGTHLFTNDLSVILLKDINVQKYQQRWKKPLTLPYLIWNIYVQKEKIYVFPIQRYKMDIKQLSIKYSIYYVLSMGGYRFADKQAFSI